MITKKQAIKRANELYDINLFLTQQSEDIRAQMKQAAKRKGMTTREMIENELAKDILESANNNGDTISMSELVKYM